MNRLRNTATILTFPLIDYTTGEYYTGTWAGLTNASLTAYHWSDGVAPQLLSIAGTPVQIGASGLWQLALTAAELNIASQYIIVKLDADELSAQGIMIELVSAVIETVTSAIKAKTDLIPADPATITSVNTRLATSGYTAPDNANIGLIKAKTDLIPANPATSAQVAACLQTSGYTAPANSDITAAKTIADKLDTAMQLYGGVYRFTANALELAPTGTGEGGTLIAPTVEEIVAGMDASSTKLTAIKAKTDTISDNSTVLAAIQGLNNISVADITGSNAFKIVQAALSGRFTKSGDAYTFYDTDNTTSLFTLTISTSARTRS